jgi:adenylate kinase
MPRGIVKRHGAYLLVGPPGSGKGTQGKALGMLPGFFHCACGDVFRSLDPRTALGSVFKALSTKGRLVPDNLTVEVWISHLKARVADGSFNPKESRLVLDGIPRNIAQAGSMVDHIEVKRIFHLNCSMKSTLLKRLRHRATREKRLDDTSESVLRHRLEVYDQESKPLLDYYPRDLVSEIDADRPAHQVLLNILTCIIDHDGRAGTLTLR